jgi:N-acetylglutamate synthase-like GNAT family acetyltransferase
MIDITAHYSRQSSSALWILEFNGRIIALVALDSEGHSSALVRHFYIDEQYIRSHVQDDLLSHALKHAFESNPELEQITAPDSPLTPHLGDSLRAMGFQLDENATSETIGVFRWKLGMRVLHRGVWKSAHKED